MFLSFICAFIIATLLIKTIPLITLLYCIEYIDHWFEINKISATQSREIPILKPAIKISARRKSHLIRESPRINSLISSINSRIPRLQGRRFIFRCPVTFLFRTPGCVRSFFFPGSLITANSCRLTKHFLLLSGSKYAPNRHELPFGCEIGHVAGNVL